MIATAKTPAPQYGLTETCPLCHGFGMNDRSQCFQCNGWGYVKPGLDATCVHQFTRSRTVGRCLTEYSCSKCSTKKVVDSGD